MKSFVYSLTLAFAVTVFAQPEEMKPDYSKTEQPSMMSESQCKPTKKADGTIVNCDNVADDIVGKKPIKLPIKKKQKDSEKTQDAKDSK